MHWTMWSKSCGEKSGSEGGAQGQGRPPHEQGLATSSGAPLGRNTRSGTNPGEDQASRPTQPPPGPWLSRESTVLQGETWVSTGVPSQRATLPHLIPCAVHDLLWDRVDLVVHLHSTPLSVPHAHQQDPEVGTPKVQGQEVTLL